MKSSWFAVALRLPLFVLMWAALFVIKAVLVLLGLFVVPVALRFENYGKLPRWAWIWDNDQDGIEGDNWYKNKYAPNHPIAAHCPRFWWLAIRNPANNLRYVEFFDLDIVPEKVRYVGDYVNMNTSVMREKGTIGFFAWQGLQSGFWVMHAYSEQTVRMVNNIIYVLTLGLVELAPGPRHFRVRFGWKVTPTDIEGVPEWRKEDAGFALQVLLYRAG